MYIIGLLIFHLNIYFFHTIYPQLANCLLKALQQGLGYSRLNMSSHIWTMLENFTLHNLHDAIISRTCLSAGTGTLTMD